MLKFIKHHMSSIEGIEIYPVVSLLIFFIFFTGLLWYVYRMDKSFVGHMENYPLDDETQAIKKPVS